jgi:hypothetical protein
MQRIPTAVHLGFVDRRRYFMYLLIYPYEAEWTPFQTHYSENLVAPGIEPGTSGSVVRNADSWNIHVLSILFIYVLFI